jgi:hypothetical protein
VGRSFDKLDDRYLMHYCLPALAMTVLSIARDGAPVTMGGDPPYPLAQPAHDGGPPDLPEIIEDAGVLAVRAPHASVFVGLGKGGTLQVDREDGSDIDAGYRIERDGRVYSTAVVDDAPSFQIERTPAGAVIRISARFQRYRLLTASPAKTVALRLARFFGPSFNGYFKKRMIVDTEVLPGALLLRRVEVDRAGGEVRVRDEIVGTRAGDGVRRAPPVSPRLVPSARFHQRDEEHAHLAGELCQVGGHPQTPGAPLTAERCYRLGACPVPDGGSAPKPPGEARTA